MSTVQSTIQIVKSAFVLTLVGSIGLIIGLAWVQPSPAGQPVCQPDNIQTTHHEKQTLIDPDRRIFHAICLWEHRGVIRKDDVSPAGAVGPAQITRIWLKDMNIYLGTYYTLDDCKSYETAFYLTKMYWQKYNLRTDEQRARCHLGGPRAMTRKKVWVQTSEYWRGVRTYLD